MVPADVPTAAPILNSHATSVSNNPSSQSSADMVTIAYEFVDTEGNPIPELYTYLPTSYKVAQNTKVEAPSLYENVVLGHAYSWMFQGWQKSEVTAATDTVFRGVWKAISRKIESYKTDTQKITYEFVSHDATRQLPREVNDQLPHNEQINVHDEDHKYFNYREVRDADGTWSFEGWDIKSYTPTEEEKIEDKAIFAKYLKYTGSWKYTPSNTLPSLDVEATKSVAKDTLFDLRALIHSSQDAEDGTYKVDDVDIRGIVDVGKKGTYTLSYRLFDSKLAVTEKTSQVTVGDSITPSAPVLNTSRSNVQIDAQPSSANGVTNSAANSSKHQANNANNASLRSSSANASRAVDRAMQNAPDPSDDMVTVSYQFKYVRIASGIQVDPQDVSPELTTYLPQSYRVKKGTKVAPPHMYDKDKRFSYNKSWLFGSWDKESAVANKDIVFVGTWQLLPVNVIRPSGHSSYFTAYSFEVKNSSQALPASITNRIPKSEALELNTDPQRLNTLFPKEIHADNGVWSFTEWHKAYFDKEGNVEVRDVNGNAIEALSPDDGWYDKEYNKIDYVVDKKRYNEQDECIGYIDDEGNRYDTKGNLVKKAIIPTSKLNELVREMGDTHYDGCYLYIGMWKFTPASPSSLNEAPTLTLKNTEISVGDAFDPTSMVVAASDTEDGENLRDNVWAYGVINTQKAGTYPIYYTLRDKKGASIHKTATLTVKATPTPQPSPSPQADDPQHEAQPQSDNTQTPQLHHEGNTQTPAQDNGAHQGSKHPTKHARGQASRIPQTSDVLSSSGILGATLGAMGMSVVRLAYKRKNNT